MLLIIGLLRVLPAQDLSLVPVQLQDIQGQEVTATVLEKKQNNWKFSSKSVFAYDHLGQLQREDHYAERDQMSVSIVWLYDTLGSPFVQRITHPKLDKTTEIRWTREYKDGLLLKETNNQTTLERSFRYNAKRKVVEIRSCINKSTIVSIERYAYDAKGQVVREEMRSPLLSRLKVYRYDGVGNCIFTKLTTTYQVEDKSPQTTSYAYTYNEKRQKISQQELNPKGKVISSTTFFYDQAGRLSKEDGPEKNKAWIRDDLGRVVQELRWTDKELSEKTIYTYQTTPKSTVAARKANP
ncbi:MAG: hypothetical protein AAF587_32270 [Bacteroidota bacterium]